MVTQWRELSVGECVLVMCVGGLADAALVIPEGCWRGYRVKKKNHEHGYSIRQQRSIVSVGRTRMAENGESVIVLSK